MNSNPYPRLSRELQGFSEKDLKRRLTLPRGIDFSSNDYLGHAIHPLVTAALIEDLQAGVAAGSGGSRLSRGNHLVHEQLESFAAKFFGFERALFLNSGFVAN